VSFWAFFGFQGARSEAFLLQNGDEVAAEITLIRLLGTLKKTIEKNLISLLLTFTFRKQSPHEMLNMENSAGYFPIHIKPKQFKGRR
jgi:hypothetical protein